MVALVCIFCDLFLSIALKNYNRFVNETEFEDLFIFQAFTSKKMKQTSKKIPLNYGRTSPKLKRFRIICTVSVSHYM